MALTQITGVPPEIRIKAGKSITVQASTDGDKNQKRVFYIVVNGPIEVNGNKITAEKVTEDKTGEVRITSQVNPRIEHILRVLIEKIPPLKIEPKNNLEVISGGEIQLGIKFEKEKVNLLWEIENFSREKGAIDPVSGLYKAPPIISTHADVTIKVRDRITGQSDQIIIRLLPIEMQTGPQPRINAGSSETQLNIWVYRDNAGGRDNFRCEIISAPKVGAIRDGGFYTPPKTMNQLETVRVRAISKADPTKTVETQFELDFSLCHKCSSVMNANGCPNCVGAVAPAGPVNTYAIKRCPRCQASGFTGTCRKCNFPRRRNRI